MMWQRLTLLVAVTLTVLPGCATAPSDSTNGSASTGSVRSDRNYYDGKYKEVVTILNPDLAREVYVDRVMVGENNHGLLRVGLFLNSQSGRSIRTEAQVLYYDEQNAPLFSGSPDAQSWMPLTVKNIGMTEHYSQAISGSAKNFMIRLRYAPGEKPYVPPKKNTAGGATTGGGGGETGASNPTKSRASSKR